MIRLVTDSSCDLPAELLEELQVTVVPLTVRFGEETFTDGADLDRAGFWERLTASPSLPEIGAPAAGAFLDAFTRLGEEGAEGVVAITLSSRLSATYQSAVIAAEKLAGRLPVRVVDSRAVSGALGLQVAETARVAREGGDLVRVTEAALAAVPATGLLVAVDTLAFLHRGGQIGRLQRMLGSALDVKPLVTLEEGVLAPAGRVRGRGRAVEMLARKVGELADHCQRLAVLHGSASHLEELLTALGEVAPAREPWVAELGPVVGTHTGPGALAVAWCVD